MKSAIKKWPYFWSKIRVTSKLREDLYRAISRTTKEGLAPTDVLEKLKINFKKNRSPLFFVIDKVLFHIRGGSGGSSAIKKTPGTEFSLFFPSDEVLLIQAGEESGQIGDGYLNAAELIANKRKMRSIITEALIKPLAYVVAFLGLMMFMSLKIIPSFEKSRPRDQWPADAAALGWMADNIIYVSVGLSIFIVVFTIIISILSEKWTGPTRDYFDKKIPPFTLIAQIKATSLMAALAGFLNAGISFVDAIQKISNSPSPYMKFQCKRMLFQIRQGKRAEDILINLPIIHKNYHWIIDVYSMIASSGDSYGMIAKEIMETSMKKIKIIGDIAANIILVMLSIGIMWVYFGMMAIANSGR